MGDDLDLTTLNPGIRDVVALLRSEGFETTDSGDGYTNEGMEGALDVPHVHCSSTSLYLAVDAQRMRELMNREGVRDDQMMIQATYSPIDGVATVSLFNVDNFKLGIAQREKRS